MYMQQIEDMKTKLWLVALIGIGLSGCAGNGSMYPEVDTDQPLTVKAEISDLTGQESTRAAVTENEYDRSSFVTGDAIRIVRTKGGAESTLNYTLSGSGAWGVPTGTDGFRFESAATYQATFPTDYTSIRPNQQSAANYRLSNLLQTPAVSVSRLGVIDFTGDTGAFKHQNVKLTLNFVGSNNTLLSFSSVGVQAPGLYSGGTATENVYFLRPDDNAYTWHAIVYPKGIDTTITVSFTDANGVTYKTDLSCGMVAGKNYIYTLTVRNNILIALGSEIKAWQETVVNIDGGGLS